MIFGLRRALVNSVTANPSSLQIFWATVLSGRRAWSDLLSCLNFRLPKWSTAETTRKTAVCGVWCVVCDVWGVEVVGEMGENEHVC